MAHYDSQIIPVLPKTSHFHSKITWNFLARGLIRSAYIWTLEGLNLKKYKPFIRNVRYVEFFISFLVFWPLDKCPHGKLVVNKSRNSVIGRLTVHHYLENYIYHFGMTVRLSPPSNDKLGRGGRAWTFFRWKTDSLVSKKFSLPYWMSCPGGERGHQAGNA